MNFIVNFIGEKKNRLSVCRWSKSSKKFEWFTVLWITERYFPGSSYASSATTSGANFFFRSQLLFNKMALEFCKSVHIRGRWLRQTHSLLTPNEPLTHALSHDRDQCLHLPLEFEYCTKREWKRYCVAVALPSVIKCSVRLCADSVAKVIETFSAWTDNIEQCSTNLRADDKTFVIHER